MAGNTPPVLPGRMALTMLALFLGMFTANLDSTILATAVPKVTDKFHSVDDIGWYGSSAFLTFAAFQTSWGKAFKHFDIKWSYLVSLFIFELGSLICAAAPSSAALIAGRAVAGVGGAGLCTGTFVVIGHTAPPQRQPAYMGVMGATYALASFVGPIIGGVFAQSLSWRWCFWINLPIGGLAAVIIIFFLRLPETARPEAIPLPEKLSRLDLVGCGLILSAVVCYLLALQWGGVQKSWSDSTVIGTLVGFVLLSALFVANEAWMAERASIVPRLLKKRRVLVNLLVVFFNSGGFFILIYYLPIYFQAIKDDSPLESGVHNLPFLVGGVFTMLSGVVLSVTNQWVPFMVLSATLSAVGGGLLYTLDRDTGVNKWIGYQILAGVSTGFLSQIPIMANTAATEMADMSTVSAMTLLFQLIGGSFSVSAAQSIFTNILLENIKASNLGLSNSDILSVGASELRKRFLANQLPAITVAYMEALKGAYALATAMLAVSAVLAVLPKWEKLRPTVQIEDHVSPDAAIEKDYIQSSSEHMVGPTNL